MEGSNTRSWLHTSEKNERPKGDQPQQEVAATLRTWETWKEMMLQRIDDLGKAARCWDGGKRGYQVRIVFIYCCIASDPKPYLLETPNLLPYRICRSGIWEKLSWSFWLTDSHELAS
jgi:hypothetical protein